MSIFVSVGNTVVGAFSSTTSREYVNCIRALAPGVKPRIKKCPQMNYHRRAQMRNKNEARQQTKTNQVGGYQRFPRYLKPGEFKL